MSAAALSAAVDSLNFNGNTPNSQAEPTPKKQPPQTPAALREKGSGEEGLLSEKPPPPQNLAPTNLFGREREGGKDSHSRQWRLSMAVFLNRNKRPSAAPIEVAEASLREAASLAYPPAVPFSLCSYFLSFYFYFVVKFIRTICTQALPNDWFCRTIGARSKRGGYLG